MTSILNPLNKFDQSVFLSLNQMHSPFWDQAMSLFTQTQTWILFYLILIFFIIRRYRSKALAILLLLAVAILISDQFSVLIKETVKRFRPAHDPAIQHLVHNVYSKGGLFGFFSSHASNTFVVAMFTSKLFRNYRYSLLIFLWALLISYTRIYIRVHYPFDVLTGMVAGMLIGHFIFLALSFTENHFLLLKSPRLSETPLGIRESQMIWLLFIVYISVMLITISRLMHIQAL